MCARVISAAAGVAGELSERDVPVAQARGRAWLGRGTASVNWKSLVHWRLLTD